MAIYCRNHHITNDIEVTEEFDAGNYRIVALQWPSISSAFPPFARLIANQGIMFEQKNVETSNYPAPAVDVVAAILVRLDGAILMCQRPASKPYPLKWEFPGGKVEPGESHIDCLRRELREELEIDAVPEHLFHQETTRYGQKRYNVSFYIVRNWTGQLVPNDAADLRWTAPDNLSNLDILEGNRSVCQRLASTFGGAAASK